MNEQQLTSIMSSVVALATKDLTNEELAVLNNVAQLDMNPHGRLFDYEKVKSLFTEQSGSRMHQETKAALARVVLSRLSS